MEKTHAAAVPLVERCREWCREAEGTWPRLQGFVEGMIDRIRIHESGGRVQRQLPEDSHTVAELAYWQVQWVLGMGPVQLCDNTVAIARSCRAFLFAGELNRQALSHEARKAFGELLEYTQLVETVLLMETHGSAKSRRLEHLANAIYRSCQQLR